VLDGVKEAVSHVAKYGSGHSDAIITENFSNAEFFLNAVDSACVYVNASTRFTDGGEFGFGAEVGISTNKLHSRGPMGVNDLTTYKYKIFGNGQIRE
jgi:glutamate-5-semialdehyde dehydrogenase